MHKRVMAIIKAPCAYLDEDKHTDYPTMDCNGQCKTCGWNPEESARRKREGRRVKREDTGLWQLVFPAV